ncbi:MAG: hypothetical protein NTX07_08700 [Solirubrobacterales bacterium]|nr:hypothetical protein [Solirubrobacterales bacterium]
MHGPAVILVVLTGAVCLGWATFLALARQGAFFGLILALTVFEATRDFALTPEVALDSAFYIGHTGTIGRVGGVEVHIEDLITLVALFAAAVGALRFRGGPWLAFALLGITAMVLVGLACFAQTEGLTHAINYWRKWLLAVALFAWGATRPRDWEWKDLRWLVGVGLMASVLAVAEISIHGLGSAVDLTVSNGQALNGRPLAAQAALIVLMAAWVTALGPGRRSVTNITLTAFLVLMVGVLQVRSVWLAAGVSLAVCWMAMFLRSGRFVLPRIAWSAIAAIVGLVALAAAVISSPSLRLSLTSQKTYQWRVSRWDESFGIARSGVEWLFGGMFGPTPVSVIGRFNGLYAHSVYVWSTETVGLVGTVATVSVICLACFRPSKSRSALWPAIVGSAALSYGYTYGLPGWYWLLIGSCAGWTVAEHATARGKVPIKTTARDSRPAPAGSVRPVHG